MKEQCDTCCKILDESEVKHGCTRCHLDSGLSEIEFKNNLIVYLKKENKRLFQANDMIHIVCNGMRRVCAIARMINHQRPDIRMTHALNDYDINKLNDYGKENK